MTMIELLQSIPARYRQLAYFTYAVVLFVLGAIDVGMESAGVLTDPTWFVVTGEVVKYLGIPVLAVAGFNVTTASRPLPAPDAPAPQHRDERGAADPLRLAVIALVVLAAVFLLLLIARQLPG